MKFKKSDADLYIPSGKDESSILSKTNFLGIAAHQDDLEIIAFPGILQSYKANSNGFGGVVCTDGVPRNSKNTEEINKIRKNEQKRAADIGKYGFVIQLDYSSDEIIYNSNIDLENEIIGIINEAKPDIIYTHNPFDKHKTHLSVCRSVINALRNSKCKYKPDKLYGCEVWRDLDWLEDKYKVEFDVSGSSGLGLKLLEAFKSQIIDGKNYHKAVIARRTVNATFSNAYLKDKTNQSIYGIDLTPLINDKKISIRDYLFNIVNEFENNIKNIIIKYF